MPIATPEVYAEMLDRAKAGAFAYPAINCTSSQTIVAAIRGFAEAEQRRHRPVLVGRRGVRLAARRVKDMVTGAVALAEFAHVVAEKYDVQIALHTDHCPKDEARRLHAPADRRLARARRRGPAAAVPVAHVGRLGRAARGEPRRRRGAARQVPPRQHHHGARDRRRRRRGGRHRRHARRQAVLDGRGRSRDRREARSRRARPLHGRRDLRQRARRLQAGQRRPHARRSSRRSRTRSAPSTARTSRSTSSSTAARARCSPRSARRSTTAS